MEYILARGLEGAISRLPRRSADPIGTALGRLVQRPFGIRRRTVVENLQRAFPDAAPEWIEATARETYGHLGREVVAMVRLSRMSREEIVALTDVPSWPQVQKALAEGNGALLVTGHYGNWEVAAAAVAARGVPISAVVKPQRNRLVDAMVQVPRVLAEGGVIGIVADQDARQKGIWVPFFGIPASTFRGPAQFALRFNAAVFASIARRLPDGRYRVEGTRIPLVRTGDAAEDERRLTATLAAHLEQEIRKDPTQYFWFHKRWKTVPPSEL